VEVEKALDICEGTSKTVPGTFTLGVPGITYANLS